MAKKKFADKLNGFNYEPLVNILSIIIVILFIINLFFITSLTTSLKDKIAEAEEAARPANLQLVVLTNIFCGNNCFNINSVVSTIKSGNVKITSEDNIDVLADNTLRSSDLIKKYGIKKLPTVIVTGEIDKSGLNSTLTQVDDALIFTQQAPPYFDVASQKVKGLVSATIIEASNCDNCTDVNLLLNQLKSSGVVIQSETTLNEIDGRSLINNYGIKTLPSLILSKDASEYDLIKKNWASLGSVETDGNLVLRNLVPPYKNLETGKVDGLVTLTYVVDSSCAQCYNVSVHKQILKGYGIIVVDEKTYDVKTNEGLAYAKQNNITLVPTMVLSSDAKLYAAFYRVFIQVAQEYNGNLIFTSLGLMGNYKDITTGKVISPQQQSASSATA